MSSGHSALRKNAHASGHFISLQSLAASHRNYNSIDGCRIREYIADMTEFDAAGVGKRVRAKREASGLTQEKLADIVGITGRHLFDIEQGEKIMSILIIHKLREALNVSADWLMDGKEWKKGEME